MMSQNHQHPERGPDNGQTEKAGKAWVDRWRQLNDFSALAEESLKWYLSQATEVLFGPCCTVHCCHRHHEVQTFQQRPLRQEIRDLGCRFIPSG